MQRLKNNTKRGHGLELWRKLYRKGVTVSIEHADAIENSLNAMKQVSTEKLEQTLEVIRETIKRHDEIADEAMKDSTKRLAIMRVLPQQAADHVAAAASTGQLTYESLEAKVVTWAKPGELGTPEADAVSTDGPWGCRC